MVTISNHHSFVIFPKWLHHARMLLLVTLMVVLHLEVREARDEPIIPSFGTPEDGLSCVSCGFGTRRQ